MSRSVRGSVPFVALLASAPAAWAQCHEWAHDFSLAGLNGAVKAYATYDEGNGPVLFVGGNFGYAGELLVRGIARWDGLRWSALGTGSMVGVVGSVHALAVYDDGSGAQLYAAGAFSYAGEVYVHNIARWDGTSWSALGTGAGIGTTDNGTVNALCVYDDGAGARLYLAGAFLHAGGLVANNIARWSASGWDAFTSGADGYPLALAVFDDGNGPRLAVAGQFTQCGSIFASNVAAYDGAGFAPLGAGTNAPIATLGVFDDGTGPALVAGGSFTQAGGSPAANIAAWRNSAWSALGAGLDGEARSLAVFDEGAGARLFAGGTFTQAGGQPAIRLARWDGAQWSAPGAAGQVSPDAAVPALGVHDDGNGAALYVGTDVRIGASSWTHGIARWDGSDFQGLGVARNNQINNPVESFAVFDDGTGPGLYGIGTFTKAGGSVVSGIARWNGARWKPLGGGLTGGYAHGPLTVVDHGLGARLYAQVVIPNAGGNYSELRSWDGSAWTTVLSTSAGSQIWATGAFDDGNGEALYVGGNFHSIGGTAATGIARFDGSTWSAVGAGVDGPSPSFGAASFLVHDDGGGPRLVVTGLFDSAGGQPAQNIAEWDGASWSALGAGIPPSMGVLATFDDGTGPRLYVGGAPGPLGCLARFDGSTWSSVPQGPNNWVNALRVFDDGGGPALVVGGSFSLVGGSLTAAGIARWDGTQWSGVGGGVMLGGTYGGVRSLEVFDDGTGGGPDLFVGGNFLSSGGVKSPYVAKWLGCSAPIASFCHGDGLAWPCPCLNDGSAGRGCANSANPAGAQLAWSGGTSPDTLVLASSGELASALSIFLQGNEQQTHAGFGDGLRCVAGSLKRLYVHNASGGSVSAPSGADPSISARSAALGDPIAPGTKRFYQVYYRDPQPGFCPAPQGSSWNVSNGVVAHW